MKEGIIEDNKETQKSKYILISILVFLAVFILLSFVLPKHQGHYDYLDYTIAKIFFNGISTLLIWAITVSISIIIGIISAFKINSKSLRIFALISIPLILLSILMYTGLTTNLYGTLTSDLGYSPHYSLGGSYYLGEDVTPVFFILILGIMTLVFSIIVYFLEKLEKKYLRIILIVLSLIFIISLFLLYSSSKKMNENYLEIQCNNLFNYVVEKEYGVDFSLYSSRISEVGDELLLKRTEICKKDLEKYLNSYSQSYAGLWKEKWSKVNETEIAVVRNWANS